MGVAVKSKSKPTQSSRHAPPELLRENDVVERFDRLADSVLLTEVEVARVVGHPPNTLKHWRLNGEDKGPKPVRMPSASIRYRVADVREWLGSLSK
jgi:predicted DNA-binding transcriptional regulator AlpA